MLSYGSRVHKVANIFRRVQGLLENGAMEPTARPLWFDVYKAFPPKIEPNFERPLPANLEVREILYAEDRGRAAFLRKYHNDDLYNLFCINDCGTFLYKFVEKGREMGAETNHDLWEDDVFLDKVRESLQKDGILLTPKSSSS